mgnify:FL=1
MFSNPYSTECLNKEGKPRRSYLDRESASEGAHYALETYGNRMVPYHCDRCNWWHLCPAERHTPGHRCHDCGKQAYDSEGAAERRAYILGQEQGTSLRVYQCPYGSGWHLTSRV